MKHQISNNWVVITMFDASSQLFVALMGLYIQQTLFINQMFGGNKKPIDKCYMHKRMNTGMVATFVGALVSSCKIFLCNKKAIHQ